MTSAAVTPPSALSNGSLDTDEPVLSTVFVTGNYLEERTGEIRSRGTPWESYHKAQLITETEQGLLRCYQRDTQENNDRYAALFISLLQKIVRTEPIQHILVLIDDMLNDDAGRVQLYLNLAKTNADLPYGPLLKWLDKDDEYISAKTAKILTLLICSAGRVPPQDFSALLDWLVKQLYNVRVKAAADLAAQLLSSLLHVHELRAQFYQTPRGMSAVMDALKRNKDNPQMQYQLISCIWLLSFEVEIAEDIDHTHGVISVLIEIAKHAIKEKVIRVSVATFRNLVEKALPFNLSSMLVHRLLPFCEQLLNRKFQDTDILEDVQVVRDQLQVEFQNISSFEVYVTELESGRLDWTPVHLSEHFWQQNVQRFNENDYALLKLLAQQLASATGSTELAVAAHDIGQYVKHCPQGKRILQDIGAKQRIMELMAHENPDVRYQALVAVQSLMVHAW
ncbi:ATPase V1 complex subunit H [Thamnocephalis sphaerospora]|uniref:V-type proton ATPase subunit H n=1 Tax=Thamnocephalis sphaerospora TaxID=78915 RepID=A0A4P9XXL7_9FUNG|nr:ATPase V1 complex subunit H [Thamnocephalis sphaerospora]|eukprot:RKP11128.1 ATPase V1 complex subunit H [Thamnocephalis sphaerospora]